MLIVATANKQTVSQIEHNFVKNLNWQKAQSTKELNLGLPNTNSSCGRVEDSNLELLDDKSIALTTSPDNEE